MKGIGKSVLKTSKAISPDKVVGSTFCGMVEDVKEFVRLAKKVAKKRHLKPKSIIIGILPDKTVVCGITGAKKDIKEISYFAEGYKGKFFPTSR